MRQNHIKVFYSHCREARIDVDPVDSLITFARSYEVNGIHIREDWAELRFTPFGELHLSPPADDAPPEFAVPYRKFLDELTDEDILQASAGNVTVIPVSTIELIDGYWFKHAAA